MHPPPYYAVHPHAMVHHHHHHHLMQVSSLEDDEWFEQKLHQYEDIMKMLLKRMEMAIAGSSSFLPVPVQLQRERSSPEHPGKWTSIYPAPYWKLDITKNHHPDNLTKQQNLIFSWHQKQSPTCQPGASGSPNPDLCGKSLPSAQFSAKESAVHQSWGCSDACYDHEDVSFPLLLIIPFPFLWRRNFMRKEV